jgi:hypothetical protein
MRYVPWENGDLDLFNLYFELASDAARRRRLRLRGGSGILMSWTFCSAPIAKTATELHMKSAESRSPG